MCYRYHYCSEFIKFVNFSTSSSSIRFNGLNFHLNFTNQGMLVGFVVLIYGIRMYDADHPNPEIRTENSPVSSMAVEK